MMLESKRHEELAFPGISTSSGPVTDLHNDLCHIIAGDLDYISSPFQVQQWFQQGWEDRQKVLAKVLKRALNENISVISFSVRSKDIIEQENLMRLGEFAQKHPDFGFFFNNLFNQDGFFQFLQCYKGRPLLNYLSGERIKLNKMLPLLEKHPCPVVIQPIGDSGMPGNLKGRIQVIETVLRKLSDIEFPDSFAYVDCLSTPFGSLPYSSRIILDTIFEVKSDLGLKTILWPENVGLGQPNPSAIVATFVSMAIQAGLDIAVVNTNNTEVLTAIRYANKLRSLAS